MIRLQTNPFNPTFGDVPQVLVNKHQVPAQDLAQLIESSNYPRAIFITGVRGSGKTVLLTKTEKELARQPKCCVIDLLNNETLIEDLKQQLAQAAANPVEKGLAKLSSLSAAGTTLEFQAPGASDQVVICQLLEKIKQQGKYVVVVIDEVDNSPVIREFAQLFSAMKRLDLPLFALMTGLPDLVLDVQTADRLTFLLRADKVALSPLNLVAMTRTIPLLRRSVNEWRNRAPMYLSTAGGRWRAIWLLLLAMAKWPIPCRNLRNLFWPPKIQIRFITNQSKLAVRCYSALKPGLMPFLGDRPGFLRIAKWNRFNKFAILYWFVRTKIIKCNCFKMN